MASYDEVLAAARSLRADERQRLAREIGAGGLGMARPAAQSVAWVKSERGHAVLATDTGPADAEIPAGAAAIAGMWSDLREDGS